MEYALELFSFALSGGSVVVGGFLQKHAAYIFFMLLLLFAFVYFTFILFALLLFCLLCFCLIYFCFVFFCLLHFHGLNSRFYRVNLCFYSGNVI
jgi:hypothetical protein